VTDMVTDMVTEVVVTDVVVPGPETGRADPPSGRVHPFGRAVGHDLVTVARRGPDRGPGREGAWQAAGRAAPGTGRVRVDEGDR
jgi:hypothetical protein